MALNGIDISNYQRGLDLSQVPCDFVICKATEGVNIVHDTCDPWIQSAKKLGKKWGFYHFFNGADPVSQADYFVANCKNYFKEGMPALDYEMYGRVGTDKAKTFLDRVYELTGVRCAVYTSRSVLTEEDWSEIAPNHPLWVAQYANNERTGYQESPWLPDGSFGAWDTVTLHQYTSNGRPGGYDGPLDLDIAYLTVDGWDRISNPSGATIPDVQRPEAQKDDVEGTALELAARVMSGEFGDGEDRKKNLGNRYDEVQDIVNYVLTTPANRVADAVERGQLGNGELRKKVLGNRYDEIQAIVNQRAGVGSARVYTVKSGDTLSEIGSALGVDWKTIASKNGIGSPYTIYPGQKLSY